MTELRKGYSGGFFLGRPFLPVTFLEFIERLERSLNHPVIFIYWVDQQSGFLLKDRPGWKMHFRETLSCIHGMRISKTPQSYSIWTYNPSPADASQVKERTALNSQDSG